MRETGNVIADRYVLEELIGEGGMASVWAATHRVTGRAVALKFLAQDRATLEEARARFLREARASSLVQHPNVVPVHDVVTLEDGTLVMVMDRLFGETLRERLEVLGRLTPEETAAILVPVLSAVGTAHAAGVVHRDLKPENIFITDEDDVKVLDFGIAKLTAKEHQGDLTNTGALLGTPYYMAPEQIFGERDLDARADVWSLGVILYECLTGERPFEGDNAGQIMKAVLTGRHPPATDRVPDLPGDLVDLLEGMLTIDRADRSADLTAAFAVLGAHTPTEAISFGRAVAPRSIVPPPSGPGSRPRPSGRGAASSHPPPSADGDPTSAPTERLAFPERLASPEPMTADTADTVVLTDRAPLSDTLATAGSQERPLRAERSGLRPLVVAAAVAGLGVAAYLAYASSRVEAPSAAEASASPAEAPVAGDIPLDPTATSTATPSPEPERGAEDAPPEVAWTGEGRADAAVSAPVPPRTVGAPPAPRSPASAPPSAAPPAPPPEAAPPPSSLPHGVHGEVPF